MSYEREVSKHEVYRITVKGVLDARWSDWFQGMRVTAQPGNTTVLTGPVVDQAALHGLLDRIRDMGLPLVSVERVDEEDR
jgi:hypothetical protein